MTITAEQQACLDSLELKENSELYKLAIFLLETPSSNRGNLGAKLEEKQAAWNKAINTFCFLAQAPSEPGAVYTPLTLFLKIAHHIINPLGLLKAILRKAQGYTKLKIDSFDIGLYDGNTAIVFIEQITLNIHFPQDLLKFLSSEHLEKMFAPLKDLNTHQFLCLLQKLSTLAYSSHYTLIISSLLACQPATPLNTPLPLPVVDLKIPCDPFMPLKAYKIVSNFCELAILHCNEALLKLFIPRTPIDLQFEALQFAIQYDRTSLILVLLKQDPDKSLTQKIILEGQELLKTYLDYSKKIEETIIEALLDAGCQYDQHLNNYLPKLDCLRQTRDFLVAKTPNKMQLSIPMENIFRLNLHYNARNQEGNTAFSLLFDLIMQADPTAFNSLIMLCLGHPVTPNAIIMSIPNNKDQTIHSLPYLDKHQQNCLSIAEGIKEAQSLWFKLNKNNNLSDKEKHKCIDAFANKIEDSTLKMDTLSLDPNSKLVLCLSILHLHTSYTLDTLRIMYTSQAWVQRIKTLIGSLRGADHFRALNHCIHYIFSAEEQNFSTHLYSVYTDILQEILLHGLQDPTIRLKPVDSENPFEILFKYSNKKILPIVKMLLQSNITPDIIIDKHQNSVLHIIFSNKNKTEEWKQVMELIFKKRLSPYTSTMALANCDGNTPLHIALNNNLSNSYIFKLLFVLLHYKFNIHGLNKNGFTPFYCAIQNGKVNFANHMLQTTNPSIHLKAQLLIKNPTPTAAGTNIVYTTVTALTLWARAMSTVAILSPLSLEALDRHRDSVNNSLKFAINLLGKGCHFPTTHAKDSEERTTFMKHIQDYQAVCTSWWDAKFPDPFPNFFMQLEKLTHAWQRVESIEQGNLIPYAELHPDLLFANTRRFSDDKTMFEILISTYNQLTTESNTVGQDTENKNWVLKAKITQLNEIVSCMLLQGVQHQNLITHKDHLTCAAIAQKIMVLKNDHQKWLESLNWVKPETKEQSEAVIRNPEELSRLTEDIYHQLQHLDSTFTGEYLLFTALSYFECAKYLFRMNKKSHRLEVPLNIVVLANKYLQEALSLSRCFSTVNILFREPMVQLNTELAPCIPDEHGRFKLTALLEKLIPHTVEATARESDAYTFEQADDTLCSYADGKLSPFKADFHNPVLSICTAIPDALTRGAKLIEALKTDLDKTKAEALAKEQLLQAKIKELEQERALTIPEAVPNPNKRSEPSSESENASEYTSEKKAKKMP